ncbi:MAG: Subunit of KEOPS complex tRNA A37 threonylcarbamoyltransferase [Candidatus Methanohalarchaeum thermophilum]|uniref:tRNA N6-adenosine threonylcarbamoyltransferase n=1 Tax=Methanohalarchaeum thermophilum TaxID=1903181 RepID=A0A1Q6DV61_METT1|nr:MAG: Subunit of KEOPS complex tRNA A37 threonylcarbamoyltransferase [Candidatus Methanohalarchaeum thermophilum]
MIALGIESTAWNLSIGIVDEKNILAHKSDPYIPETGGIHPRDASQHHSKKITELIAETIKEAGIDKDEIDLIGFSRGPGMGPCLRVAATASRALSLSLEIPIIGVNHCIAHIEVGRWVTEAQNPVIVYVSGANSQILGYKSNRYRVFGETLDIGAGNALDKFGRNIGLSHPGGPKVEELAEKGNELIDLPYVVKGMDFSFSGIVTSATSKAEQKRKEDLCFSIQEIIFSMLTEVTERALAHSDLNEVLLCGGVGKNKRIQEMLQLMSEDFGSDFYVPNNELLGDNGAMIAHTALKMNLSGEKDSVDVEVKRNFRPDEVEVSWRD